MLRKPDDRTPANVLSEAAIDVLDSGDGERVSATFAKRLWERQGTTLEVRGGQYPDPNDYTVEAEIDGPLSPDELLSDDWEDTRVHVNVFDMAESEDEEAVLILLDRYDADDCAWITTRPTVIDALAAGFSAGEDDDWEVCDTYRGGDGLLHAALERAGVRVVDATDVAAEKSPYTAHAEE